MRSNTPTAILIRCVWTFGWFVPWQESGCTIFVFEPQQLVILLGLAVRHFSAEAYTSTLRCCSVIEIGRNLVYLVQKMRQKEKKQLNVCTSLVDSYSSSHATTATKLRRTPDGVCEGVGIKSSSRRQPETIHEVFLGTRRCEPAAQRTRKIAKYLISCAGA